MKRSVIIVSVLVGSSLPQEGGAQPWPAPLPTTFDRTLICPRQQDRLEVYTQLQQLGYWEPYPLPANWTYAPRPANSAFFFNVPSGAGWTAFTPEPYRYGQNTWGLRWMISVNDFLRRAGVSRPNWTFFAANLSNLGSTTTLARDLTSTWGQSGDSMSLLFLQSGPDRRGNQNATNYNDFVDPTNGVWWTQYATLHCVADSAPPLPPGSRGGSSITVWWDWACYTWRCQETGTFR